MMLRNRAFSSTAHVHDLLLASVLEVELKLSIQTSIPIIFILLPAVIDELAVPD